MYQFVRSLNGCLTINIKPINTASLHYRAHLVALPLLHRFCEYHRRDQNWSVESVCEYARSIRDAELVKVVWCILHGSQWGHYVMADDVVTLNQNIGVDSNTIRARTDKNCTEKSVIIAEHESEREINE